MALVKAELTKPKTSPMPPTSQKSGATIRKKSRGEKFAQTFLSGSLEETMDHVIFDIVIPSAKDLVLDALSNTISMMLFGETRKTTNVHRDRDRTYVAYDKFSKSDRDSIRPRRSRPSVNVDDVIFKERWQAEKLLDDMVEIITNYEQVSVAQMYELAELDEFDIPYTYERYGWVNLSTASIRPTRGGWLVDLPRPMVLE